MNVLVDCAGGAQGGARRFRDELEAWLARNPAAPIRLGGVGRTVNVGYLAAREIRALYGRPRRVVALNNVGFVACRAERWVLLRNALHFPVPGEDMHVSATLAQRLAAKAVLVRYAAQRADVVVVPTSTMAERVLRRVPGLSGRLVVMPHPVSPRPPAAVWQGLVVCPVLFEPYKRMGPRLHVLEKAIDQLRRTHGWSLDVRVTATREELDNVGHHHPCLLTPVGRLPTGQLAELLSHAQVIYYPTDLESFGYPLAEARANGQPVVAPDCAQTREVAGPALVPYDEDSTDALAAALSRAFQGAPPPPDPVPFCPDSYFRRWLA